MMFLHLSASREKRNAVIKSAGKRRGSDVEEMLLLSCRLLSQVTAFGTSATYVLTASLTQVWNQSSDALITKTGKGQKQSKRLDLASLFATVSSDSDTNSTIKRNSQENTR